MTLKSFLSQKPLFYTEFDPFRIKKIWNKISHNFSLPKIIHIVGTNGKGTTGRFLANYLYEQGIKTGHYTSPHISKFNERIWLNGKDVEDGVLENSHNRLLKMLEIADANSLSYFEYTTLLCIVVFEKECEYMILEAGLGGEYDATSIFDPVLLLITSIGIDHKDFLGSTIEEISKTKLNVMKSDAIIGFQDYSQTYDIAKQKAEQIYKKIFFLKDEYNILQCENYLDENRLLALKAAKYLGFDVKIDDFEKNRLFGRFTNITKNIIIDVGHNLLAAKAIKRRLGGKRVKLIYNTLADKEYRSILHTLKENIITLEIIDIDDERKVAKEDLVHTLDELDIKYCNFEKIKNTEDYLVFGSFKTVESFCKKYYEK